MSLDRRKSALLGLVGHKTSKERSSLELEVGLAGVEGTLERPWGGVRGDRPVSKMVKRRSDFY